MPKTIENAAATLGGDPTMSSEYTLRDYQKVAVSFIRARKRAGLFLDM